MIYNVSMENILSTLNYANNYIFYLNLVIGLVLLIVCACLLIKVKHSSKTIKTTCDAVSDVSLKVNASKTKYDIAKNDLKFKFDLFGKAVSIVAVLKYLRKRENRRKNKEYKQFQKHQQQVLKIFK